MSDTCLNTNFVRNVIFSKFLVRISRKCVNDNDERETMDAILEREKRRTN